MTTIQPLPPGNATAVAPMRQLILQPAGEANTIAPLLILLPAWNPHISARQFTVAAMRFRWVSMAPLGLPVVPEK
jgi:hypothetical protein